MYVCQNTEFNFQINEIVQFNFDLQHPTTMYKCEYLK